MLYTITKKLVVVYETISWFCSIILGEWLILFLFWKVRANIHEMLKENEFTRTLASNELVWVMVCALFYALVFGRGIKFDSFILNEPM